MAPFYYCRLDCIDTVKQAFSKFNSISRTLSSESHTLGRSPRSVDGPTSAEEVFHQTGKDIEGQVVHNRRSPSARGSRGATRKNTTTALTPAASANRGDVRGRTADRAAAEPAVQAQLHRLAQKVDMLTYAVYALAALVLAMVLFR